VPAWLLADLGRGGGGARAGAWLSAAERTKHMLLIRAAATAAGQGSAAAAGYQVLAGLHQRAPAADAVVRHPAVGAWALRAVQQAGCADSAAEIEGALRRLAVAMAMRARVPLTMTVPVTGHAVIVPSVGRAVLPAAGRARTAVIQVGPGGTVIAADGARVEVPPRWQADAAGWQALRVVTAQSGGQRLSLVIDDVDPDRFGLAARAGRLSQAQAGQWAATVGAAWSLLVAGHRQAADEISAMITTLTPLRGDDGWQASATSRAAFGCVALSARPDGRSLALALAHEVQHAKLAALSDLVDLVRPGSGRRYYAPWREDPRPAAALLQGAYAHLGVAGFWRSQRGRDGAGAQAYAEYARWRSATAQTAALLARSGELTGHGQAFVAGMRATLGEWMTDPVPGPAAARAQAAADEHRHRWEARNGVQIGDGSNATSIR
jgi:HEXXH motif-containing protein